MSETTLTKPLARYAHQREAGGLVFLAGQGCRDPQTDAYAGLTLAPDGSVLAYDARSQAAGVLANIDRALHAVGPTASTWWTSPSSSPTCATSRR
jgi:enamine deaminase RidA (YjgF/YER057c/UK114 family)